MQRSDAIDARFTVRDYERMPDHLRCQLIEGQLVKEPAPAFGHQAAVMKLLLLLAPHVAERCCVPSPIDIVLDDFSVLQPDIAVWTAAPDIDVRWVPTPQSAIEVLSPSTERRDREQKTRLYLAAGVNEVWLVDPGTGVIEVHAVGGVTRYGPDEVVHSQVVQGAGLRGRYVLG